jgi:hypothetical protein
MQLIQLRVPLHDNEKMALNRTVFDGVSLVIRDVMTDPL